MNTRSNRRTHKPSSSGPASRQPPPGSCTKFTSSIPNGCAPSASPASPSAGPNIRRSPYFFGSISATRQRSTCTRSRSPRTLSSVASIATSYARSKCRSAAISLARRYISRNQSSRRAQPKIEPAHGMSGSADSASTLSPPAMRRQIASANSGVRMETLPPRRRVGEAWAIIRRQSLPLPGRRSAARSAKICRRRPSSLAASNAAPNSGSRSAQSRNVRRDGIPGSRASACWLSPAATRAQISRPSSGV